MVTTYVGTVKSGKVELSMPLALPEGSQVYIALFPILDKKIAHRSANVWLMENVGNVIAKNARLTQIDEQAIWCFEAFISVPHHKPLGPIGQVDIDARTGLVLTPPKVAEAMITRGSEFTPIA